MRKKVLIGSVVAILGISCSICHANKSIFDESDYIKISPSLNEYVYGFDGSIGQCKDIYKNFTNTEDLCDSYVAARDKEYNKCMSKRVTGNETKVGLKAIKDICNASSAEAGKKAVKWSNRKNSIKGLFN